MFILCSLKEGCSHANLQVSPNTFLAQRATLLCCRVALSCDPDLLLAISQDSGHDLVFWLQNYVNMSFEARK